MGGSLSIFSIAAIGVVDMAPDEQTCQPLNPRVILTGSAWSQPITVPHHSMS